MIFNRLLIILIISVGICLAEDQSVEELTTGKTCLMDSICAVTVDNVTKNSPCHLEHEPFESVNTYEFEKFLGNYCPHLFEERGILEDSICCSADQKNSMSLLYKLRYIHESCPSCAVNAQKYFCNLVCLPNQNEMVIIEKKNGSAITRISYVVSEEFAQTFFESCYDVKLFGTYLMDMEFMCGPHKRDGCDVHKFLTTLGSIPEMPFTIQPVLSTNTTTINGQTYKPMDTKAYHCYESPEDYEVCSCEHCLKSCHQTKINSTTNVTQYPTIITIVIPVFLIMTFNLS